MSEATAERKKAERDPIRAAASVLADEKRKLGRLEGRRERLKKDLAAVEKQIVDQDGLVKAAREGFERVAGK
mgnify:FL=1